MKRKFGAKGLQFLFSMILLMAVVHALSHFIFLQMRPLQNFGIYPRELSALPYILTAPFLHGSWGHLFNNAVGLLIFGSLCLLRGYRTLLFLSVVIIVLGGFVTWLIARPAVHIGASGWVFGLWSAAIAFGWFDRRFGSICLAVAVIFFYGGMIAGVLPQQAHISFEGHFAGALAGWLGVWLLTHKRFRRFAG